MEQCFMMVSRGALLSYGGAGQLERGGVHTWVTWLLRKALRKRAADSQPLCELVPGLLAYVHHRVGMGSGCVKWL